MAYTHDVPEQSRSVKESGLGCLKKLAEYLRTIRRNAKLNQYQLAEAIGTDQGSVSNIERGRNGTSFESVDLWIQACGASLEVAPTSLSTDEAELLRLYRGAGPAERASILTLLRAITRHDL